MAGEHLAPRAEGGVRAIMGQSSTDQSPQHANRAARAGGRFEDEGWRIRKDGGRFWALSVLDAIRDEDGSLIGFAKISRDITERRAAEEAELQAITRALTPWATRWSRHSSANSRTLAIGCSPYGARAVSQR